MKRLFYMLGKNNSRLSPLTGLRSFHMTCFPSQTPKPHVAFPIHVIQSLSADNTLNICVERGHSLLYCHNVLYPLSTTHCIIWTSSSETATEGPSKNQTVKSDWPVNVNNTSRTLRLDRLLNSILHLLSHVFFTLFPSIPSIQLTPSLTSPSFIPLHIYYPLSTCRPLSSHPSCRTLFLFPPPVYSWLSKPQHYQTHSCYITCDCACVCVSWK